jgi:hypothetical protein
LGAAALGAGASTVITGYIGLIGHGKTMLAVRESVAMARRRGAILASNISIDAPGLDYVRLSVGDDGLDGVPELLARAREEARGVVILVDEIGIILPARFWQTGMSIDLMWSVSQSRKLATDLIYTAQDIEQVDAFLRRLTSYVYKVKAVPSPTNERRDAGKRPWFFIRSKWMPGTVDKADKRLGRSFLRYRRSDETAYDTDELVRPPARLRAESESRRARKASTSPRSQTGTRRAEGFTPVPLASGSTDRPAGP